MRPSRRAFAAAGLGLVGLGGAAAFWWLQPFSGPDAPVRIEIRADPIGALGPPDSPQTRFGQLEFRSGLVLTSAAAGFGGLSGLWRQPDGGRDLVAISDRGHWLTARIERSAGRLSGLSAATLGPILDEAGRPIRTTRGYDAEALAMGGSDAYVAVEREHAIRRFAWGAEGVVARGHAMPVPPALRELPANAGIEALAFAPAGHALAGSLVAIAERARRGADSPTVGWVLRHPAPFQFDVVRRDGFDITDAAFLPGGELLLLERFFSPFSGVRCRIRRVGRDAIQPGALLDGPLLLDLDGRDGIDNMEGLCLHRDEADGATVLTLLSDDNFSPFQRTLLLEFTLLD